MNTMISGGNDEICWIDLVEVACNFFLAISLDSSDDLIVF
jgi:hypothetical protein